MSREITGRKATASTDGRATEERGPFKCQIIAMDRGSLPDYSITSRKFMSTVAYKENNVPSSGRPNNREIGGRSVAGCGAEHCSHGSFTDRDRWPPQQDRGTSQVTRG